MPKKKPYQQANVKRIMANVESTMKVEGIQLSARSTKITRKYLNGKISSEEAVASIIKRHSSKFDK